MLNFTGKSFGILIIFLLGITFGMNLTEKGIYQVLGDDGHSPQVLNVNKNKDEVTVAVLGKNYSSPIPIVNNLNKNNHEAKSSSSSAWTSKAGNQIGNWIEIGTRKGVELINYLFNKLLS